MANMSINTLTIEGKVADLKKFDERFKADHIKIVDESMTVNPSEKEDTIEDLKNNKNIIDFKYVSKEEHLANPNSQYTMFARDKIHYITEVKEVSNEYSYQNFIPMTKEDSLNSNYDWCMTQWGTSHDIKPARVMTDSIDQNENLDEIAKISYSFESPWGAPTPVVLVMIKQYPELKFTFKYREHADRFAGVIIGEKGLDVRKTEFVVAWAADDDYESEPHHKLFLHKHFGDDLYICKECNHLMLGWEYNQECTECNSSNVEEF